MGIWAVVMVLFITYIFINKHKANKPLTTRRKND